MIMMVTNNNNNNNNNAKPSFQTVVGGLRFRKWKTLSCASRAGEAGYTPEVDLHCLEG